MVVGQAMSEGDLVRSILEALRVRKVWSWRTNAGIVVIGTGKSKRVVRGAPAGTPDILGVLPGGILFALEAKTAGGKVSPAQKEWHEAARFHGVRVAVVYSLGQALSLVAQWRHEAMAPLAVEAVH